MVAWLLLLLRKRSSAVWARFTLKQVVGFFLEKRLWFDLREVWLRLDRGQEQLGHYQKNDWNIFCMCGKRNLTCETGGESEKGKDFKDRSLVAVQKEHLFQKHLPVLRFPTGGGGGRGSWRSRLTRTVLHTAERALHTAARENETSPVRSWIVCLSLIIYKKKKKEADNTSTFTV